MSIGISIYPGKVQCWWILKNNNQLQWVRQTKNYLQYPVSCYCRYTSLVSTLQMHQSYILIELYLWKVINMTETAAENVIWPSISYLRNSQYPKNRAACWLANHLLTSSFANLKKFQEFAFDSQISTFTSWPRRASQLFDIPYNASHIMFHTGNSTLLYKRYTN